MSFSLLPKIIANALTDITPELLHQRGIRLLMLDFDNTIVPYTTSEPTAEMESWLARMTASGIQLCVVSNSKKNRVPHFCAARRIPCITHARKPFSDGIQACLKRFAVPPAQAALVGDQIFTDTMGANGAGITSILIGAINNHNFWLKARHVLELPFIAMASGRRIS